MATAKLVCQMMYIPTSLVKMDLDLDCQFDPAELTINKHSGWEGKPNPTRNFPRTEFGGGSSATYDLTLEFDAFVNDCGESLTTRRDVREDINKLMGMTLRAGGYGISGTDMLPYLMEPPSVFFIWGDVILFRAVLVNCKATYTRFDSKGAPTHAKANCSFMEQSFLTDFLPPQNPSSRTNPRHTVRVTQGDRLDTIAADFYGDARMWRSIAEENDLDDPFNPLPGSLLSMPTSQGKH